MGTHELRNRANWQTESGNRALKVEDLFKLVMSEALENVHPGLFSVQSHPNILGDIYSTHQLPPEVLEEIYNPPMLKNNGSPKYKWGINPDFLIRNNKNGKTLFIEIKRQDGWVEGKLPAAGRGNAHERCAKYFTPGLRKKLKEVSKIKTDKILPFWVVFVGDITRDPKRNREISFWFQEYIANYFMWRNTNDMGALLDHFEEYFLQYLL